MAHLQESRFLGYWGLYRRGVIMNITNPKVTLFFLAFLPQFCAPERGSVALQVMELGLLFMLAAFIVFTAWAAAWPTGSTARRAARCSCTVWPVWSSWPWPGC